MQMTIDHNILLANLQEKKKRKLRDIKGKAYWKRFQLKWRRNMTTRITSQSYGRAPSSLYASNFCFYSLDLS